MRGEGASRIGGGKLLYQRIGLRAGATIREGHIVPGGRERAHDRCAKSATATRHQHAPRRVSHQRGSRLITSETFCPPNPKELEMTCVTRASRALFGTTSSGMVGSGT